MEKGEARKTVKTFAAVSFLNDFGSDMVFPIWPLFITQVLKANMSALGLIDGLGEAIVSLSQAASGYVSDRLRRRKPFIWLGYLFGSLSRIGYALSRTWPHLLAFRALDRVGKIRGAPRDAIIAEVSRRKDRGRNFGLLRAMDHLGATFGVVACIILFPLLGYRRIFFLAALPSLVGVILVIFLIKEKPFARTRIFQGFTLKEVDFNLGLFLTLSAIFSLGSFTYSFLLLYAKAMGFKVSFVPVLYLIFAVTASLSSLPGGKLSDKWGRKKALALSYLLWMLVCATFIIVKVYPFLLFSFILYGMHRGVLEPVQRAFTAELAPPDYKASILGGFQLVTGLCALPASLIAGLLWDKVGKEAPFYLSLSLTFLSLILLALVKEKK